MYLNVSYQTNQSVLAYTHRTGPGPGQKPGNDWFLYYTMYCTHYTRTVTRAGNHCFLSCSSPPCPCPVQCVWAISVTIELWRIGTSCCGWFTPSHTRRRFVRINVKSGLHLPFFAPFFLTILKWVEWIPMVMFTHDVTKCIKDQRCRWQKRAKSVTCKQGLKYNLVVKTTRPEAAGFTMNEWCLLVRIAPPSTLVQLLSPNASY